MVECQTKDLQTFKLSVDRECASICVYTEVDQELGVGLLHDEQERYEAAQRSLFAEFDMESIHLESNASGDEHDNSLTKRSRDNTKPELSSLHTLSCHVVAAQERNDRLRLEQNYWIEYENLLKTFPTSHRLPLSPWPQDSTPANKACSKALSDTPDRISFFQALRLRLPILTTPCSTERNSVRTPSPANYHHSVQGKFLNLSPCRLGSPAAIPRRHKMGESLRNQLRTLRKSASRSPARSHSFMCLNSACLVCFPKVFTAERVGNRARREEMDPAMSLFPSDNHIHGTSNSREVRTKNKKKKRRKTIFTHRKRKR